jgi:asparaginyl-tRNA synthetase
MEVFVKDIAKHVGHEVTVKGWVHNARSSGKIVFLQFRDGTGYVQGIVHHTHGQGLQAPQARGV